PEIRGGGGRNGPIAGRQVGGQIVKIARISVKRIRSAAPLGCHHIEEQRGQLPPRACDGFHASQCCCLTKRSGGTVTTISRGRGSTKGASATTAANPIPAITPTTASNLINVGMAAYPCGPLSTRLLRVSTIIFVSPWQERILGEGYGFPGSLPCAGGP